MSFDDIKGRAAKQFAEGPVSFFLGAGVSCSANLPKWEDLLKSLLDYPAIKEGTGIFSKDYDILIKECGCSSIITGRYIQKQYEEKGLKVEDAIFDIFYKKKHPSSSTLIKELCRLIKDNQTRVKGIITYNYDDLIEHELDAAGVKNYPVCNNNTPENIFPICHVHGIIDRNKNYNSDIVLSETEYHDIYRRAYHWSNVEQLHALQRSNCFFIGLSMMDPNLRRLLDIVQGEYGDRDSNRGNMPHFAFIRQKDVGEKLGDNAAVFRDRFEGMLKSLGVYVIWYDDYSDLPVLIKELDRLT